MTGQGLPKSDRSFCACWIYNIGLQLPSNLLTKVFFLSHSWDSFSSHQCRPLIHHPRTIRAYAYDKRVGQQAGKRSTVYQSAMAIRAVCPPRLAACFTPVLLARATGNSLFRPIQVFLAELPNHDPLKEPQPMGTPTLSIVEEAPGTLL